MIITSRCSEQQEKQKLLKRRKGEDLASAVPKRRRARHSSPLILQLGVVGRGSLNWQTLRGIINRKAGIMRMIHAQKPTAETVNCGLIKLCARGSVVWRQWQGVPYTDPRHMIKVGLVWPTRSRCVKMVMVKMMKSIGRELWTVLVFQNWRLSMIYCQQVEGSFGGLWRCGGWLAGERFLVTIL